MLIGIKDAMRAYEFHYLELSVTFFSILYSENVGHIVAFAINQSVIAYWLKLFPMSTNFWCVSFNSVAHVSFVVWENIFGMYFRCRWFESNEEDSS